MRFPARMPGTEAPHAQPAPEREIFLICSLKSEISLYWVMDPVAKRKTPLRSIPARWRRQRRYSAPRR